MPTALKKDSTPDDSNAQSGDPIDLAHLESQTLGDKALAEEILNLFMTQSEIYMKMILTSCDAPTRIRAAHSLKGGARSIGAFDLASLAAAAEKYNHTVHTALEAEHGRVLDYIRALH